MSNSTGPILAVGGITMVNQSVFNDKGFDWRIPIATGIAVALFAGLEKAMPEVAPMLAWTAVVAVVFTRVDPSIPSAAESGMKWFDNNSK